jgi:hypothetical protein
MKTNSAKVRTAGRVGVIGDSAPPAGKNRRTRTVFVRRPVERSIELGRQRAAGELPPIWLAALVASRCQANRNGEGHAIRWTSVSGRALYTNAGADAEWIQSLGVNLLGGQTLAVYWLPGETDYTLEVYRQGEKCA